MNESLVETLKSVDFLKSVDDETLGEIAAKARLVRYARGQRIVAELEPGADVYVIASGEAEVSVEPRAGEKQLLQTLGPGGAFGEMSSLTGELRSATVTATTPVTALVIGDAEFDKLRERRPQIAVVLVRVLGARLAEAERSIDALLDPSRPEPPHVATAPKARGSIARAWRELVVNRKRDLGFLALTGFALTLVAVRLVVFLSFRFDVAPKDVLRTAYLSGFLLVGLSALTSLLTFRLEVRRVVALAYGVGLALIANELGVTIAFDIFFKDIHTPDPSVPFDIERLYRRTEPLRAVALALLVLVQAAYLRPFYRRAWFVVRTRMRRLKG
jgi:CRP-like cAMP-binding protein